MTRAADAPPLVTAPLMGYGHLRAAAAMADAFSTHVTRSDRAPLSAPGEIKTWRKIRRFYERLSRVSQQPLSGYPAMRFLEWITSIPRLHPNRDLSEPTRSALTMARLAGQGFGRTLVEYLEAHDATLLSAFYAEAIVADRAGWEKIFCLVTDSDVNRVWAPLNPGATRIRYLAPTRRAARRLLAFGVPEERIRVTGFPLPLALIGEDGGVLRRNLAARLVRLDPREALRGRLEAKGLRTLLPRPRETPTGPPHLVFAVGGAGAQTSIVRRFLPGLKPLLETGRLRLGLVAGTRPEVALRLERHVRDAGLAAGEDGPVRVYAHADFPTYYAAFNALLAETDVLWTKPSELVFYAALGLPLVLSPPVGVQERANERWVLTHGAALRQGRPEHAHSWLLEWIEDGVLAGAAWSGHVRLPHDGTLRIRRAIEQP